MFATVSPTTEAATRAELDGILAGDEPYPSDNAFGSRALAELTLPLAGLIAGASAIAAALGAGFVALFTASRKVARPLDMALENIEAACDRIAAVAKLATRAQDNIATAAETAANAAKDSSSTVARLAETTTAAQARLRDWLVTADASQEKAATLANQCVRLTEILPDLLGGAVETMQARGLAAIDTTLMRLRETAGTMEFATSALRDEMAAAAAGVTAQVAATADGQNLADRLARQCQLMTESLPDILMDAISPITARDKSALDCFVDRLDRAAGLIETSTAALREGVEGITILAADHTAWHDSHSAIVRICERLSSDLPLMASDVIDTIEARGRAALESIEGGVNARSLDIAETTTRLRNEVAGLAAAFFRQSAHDEKTIELVQQCERLAGDLPTIACRAIETLQAHGCATVESVEGRLQESVLGIEAATAALQESVMGLGDTSANTMGGLAAALTRAEGIVALLPEITSNLATAAATLRREAQHGAQILEAGGTAVAQAAAVSTAAAAELPRAAACFEKAAARIGAALEAAVGEVRDAASALLTHEEACHAGLNAPAEAMFSTSPLEARQKAPITASQREDVVERTTSGWLVKAARLVDRAEAPDLAATRMARAALEVAAAAAPAVAGHLQQLPTLARLSGLAAETKALQAMAAAMAKTALEGDADCVPADLVADAPALLAAIEVSIQQLRGTATALAIASDAARLAA
jgi:hypothetical protein